MPFEAYLKRIQKDLLAGLSTEPSHYPTLQRLLEGLSFGITATTEAARIACGAPDFTVSRSTKHGPLTIGYVEAKDVGKSLDEAERSEQIKRYLPLGNLILTDFLEFRWYVEGKHRQTARLGSVVKGVKIVVDREGLNKVGQLLISFLDHEPPPINKPKELAVRLARLTHNIRDVIIEAFQRGQASSTLKDLHRAFEEVLIPDLAIPQFADMFAQTLAYGLFAARCNHRGTERFERLGAATEIPRTNPFLRKLFDMITGTALDDEPFVGFVDDLVRLLAHTDIGAVLADFGRRTRREDPVIHFYETFLAQYNPKERQRRGIYYTPEPVVSYIVRSIDHLLKTRFNCPAGLADTAAVDFTREDDKGNKLRETAPRVLILDPACGTGTFLYAVVDLIREEFMRREDAGMWSGYVREHLLPRLFGFELLMAPYAVAHFKLGMQLAGQDLSEAQREKWGYDFAGDERLGIYLTNTLEEAERRAEDLFGPYRVIAEEANAASQIKRDLPIMVVLGNPPYSVSSANKGEHIERLMERYKAAVRRERNIQPLSDDYIKFIRFAHERIERTGHGIIGMITNHSYLSGLIQRGMREELMKSFDEIYILDLHGSARMGEKAPDGGKDQNVFDIRQGVAIALFVRNREHKAAASVKYFELLGLRDAKHQYLMENDISATKWQKIEPAAAHFFFVPRELDLYSEYRDGRSIMEILPVNSTGIKTHRDQFVIDFEEESLRSRITTFLNNALSDDEVRARLKIQDTGSWELSLARKELRGDPDWQAALNRCLYRPFDIRPIYYHKALIDRHRLSVMRHMLRENVGLIVSRQVVEEFRHVFSTKRLTSFNSLDTAGRFGSGCLFPLYLYRIASKSNLFANDQPTDSPGGRRPNLNPEFVKDVEKRLGLTFVPDGTGDLKKTFGPEDIFNYMYAVFHSPTYRSRYAEFLKIDFPRLPLTSDRDLFAALAENGSELVALHLMESPALENQITHYPVPGDNLVEKVRYDGNARRVYINKEQYFEGVPPEVWEFHVGGYQVCEKWLKDRRGRKLSFEDLKHYQRTVVALRETIRLMAEIDGLIPAWPIE